MTPLHVAILYGDVEHEMVSALINAGANVNLRGAVSKGGI